MRRQFQTKIRDAERHNLPDSRAGVEHARQERIVATTIARGPVDRREHSLDLGELQVLDGTGVRALEGHGQHALAVLNALGVLCRTVPKERVNRRKPHVTGGGDIVALDFEIMKEVEYFLGAEMVNVQLGHSALFLSGDKTQPQNERVSVTADGVRTGPSHPRQMIMWTMDLAEALRDRGVTVNSLHPATFMDTYMVREAGMRPISTVEEGVDAVMHLATSPELEGRTGAAVKR